ncbi:Transmembrane protein 98 [Lamellibrachia satsuma]|nr:Transmembrane protein 98 [Lamellibrachia satsuma]
MAVTCGSWHHDSGWILTHGLSTQCILLVWSRSSHCRRPVAMTTIPGGMETVVVVAISILASIFIVSLLGLIVVCRHRYCKPISLFTHKEPTVDATLVDNMEGLVDDSTGVELHDVGINMNLDEILQNEAWVNDATGLAPRCLDILKLCHMLTNKLVGMTMGSATELQSPETLTDLVAIAKRIGPRVDDVVHSMYPPLDPRLLEARCAALVLSVSHLVLLTKNACHLSGVLDWIDQSLADVEDHLSVLREASINYETSLLQSSNSTTGDSLQMTSLVNHPSNQQPANPSTPVIDTNSEA